ncbi:uncharacterized protein LOC135816719 [Sycon ciliatum]|uniref:uncharacterized protein LOC135816719 n=1 Tax=Sycon ciliatum TaxID=27933 RepID=UPI0031F6B0C3
MALSILSAILLLVVAASQVTPSEAYWNCHACMQSVTVNIQLTSSRFAGTDNEARGPHFLELEFYCDHEHVDLDSLPVLDHIIHEHIDLFENSTVPELPAPKTGSTIKALAFQTAVMRVPLRGIFLKSHSRTFTVPISPEVGNVCGPCVAPINLRNASLNAAHSDGIQVRSVRVLGNYEDGCSGLVLLNRGFGSKLSFGWLDTTPFPFPHPQQSLPLRKAGC